MHPEYFEWYSGITRFLIGNPTHRGQLPDGYMVAGAGTVVLTNTVERCIRLAEAHMERASPQSRSVLQQMRDILRCGLNSIGARVGCRGRYSTMTGGQEASRPILCPRRRVPSRGAKGVKRGAKRRNANRPPRDEGPSQQQPDIGDLE